ncbi:MAG: hypothetical protein JSW58_03060 [Candidatus Latescibacterota bacterium]|nr:MAG: hypothetical protein JSW58_03060 [Candidatus Latescibacterota bacterium]
MKRAWLTLVAVMALVLVYPTTMPSAKSPGAQDTPTIHIITPQSGDNPAFSGEGDDGDADDLAGRQNKKTKPNGVSIDTGVQIQARLAAQIWRMYFFTFRLYR